MKKPSTTTKAITPSSPGVQRTVTVLDFFADHPGQTFTLTDLVKALKLNHSTCHALLMNLVQSGYLYRTYDKNYVVGHRLVAIGRTAHEHYSPLQVAQPEMRALADEFSAICSAFTRDGDEVVVSARAASISQLGFSIAQGTRVPLRPPFSALYFAWSVQAQSEMQAWIEQVDPPPTAAQCEQMLGVISFARTRGFLFGVRTASVAQYEEPPEQIFKAQRATYPMTLEYQIDPESSYRLAFVLAPVVNERQAVIFTLGLTGFTGLISSEQLQGMGRSLREACDRITQFTGPRKLS